MKNYVLLLFLLFFSCSIKDKKIESGDVVKKCIVTNYVIEPPNSTIEYESKVRYFTDCGESVVTRNKFLYKIGDTLTFIYKKKPN